MPSVKKIAFVSTMANAPWGGSECLWSDAAQHLQEAGHCVVASVCGWSKTPSPIQNLIQCGIDVQERLFDLGDWHPEILRKVAQVSLRSISTFLFARWLKREQPDLICISNGCFGDDLRVIDACIRTGTPYVLIAHANAECMWPDDEAAQALLEAYLGARKAFFVAHANRDLLEIQLGARLPNSELVRNPFSVRHDSQVEWPSERDGLRLACVARLHPKSKGQDLLLLVLSLEPWRSRNISVSFFGEGSSEKSLRRLAKHLDVESRVRFCGHVDSVDSIWSDHHALILPSRYEGLPISLVEAMLSRRPAIVTRVGGNAEVMDDRVTGFIAEGPTVHHLHLAMERAWDQRHKWRSMGEAAARKIKSLVPEHPGAVFAERLLELCKPEPQSQQFPVPAHVGLPYQVHGTKHGGSVQPRRNPSLS